MPKLTLAQAVARNRKNKPVVPDLISVDQLDDKTDRTLALGVTGSQAHGRAEVMHVYLKDEHFHVFSYFIGPDDRFLYSRKFSATVLDSYKLHIPNGVEWSSADSTFVELMAKVGLPLWLIPLEIWGKRPVKFHDEYFGHVPEVTCKPHPDSLNF
jgi:hypothetical protein